MKYVGVDLAWGERRPTGVAVLDSGGALLALSSATTDDEIAAQVAPYVGDDCLVAIDAPLIVTNPSGNRPCEAALNQDFGRFEAGAHPANTAKPEFAAGSRGARLAERFALDMDPTARSGRRAIEVYPHPATVALFSLRRTLKYKARPGRTLAELREALLTLTGHLEALRGGNPAMDVTRLPAWRDLVADIGTAGTKAALRRAEDQVDAVVCAYVALFSDRRPEATTTYGEAATGYIVTPTLPAELEPERRRRRSSVDTAVSQYATSLPQVQRATEHYARVVTDLLDEAGINYLGVTARAKSVKSFAAKATRGDGARTLHPDPLTDITDQVGVRVVTYLQRDVDAVARLLAAELDVLDDRDMGVETAGQGRFGYASRHLLIRLRDDERAAGRTAQVQVRTVLQHAWAEFEHATRYKGEVPDEHAPDLDRRFTLAAGLLELADKEFSAIHERLQDAAPGEHTPRSSDALRPDDLARFLTERYAEAGWSRPDHYEWVSGLLVELGITSTEALQVVLDSVDEADLTRRMGYRYPPGAVRRLDDALLAVFGERYVGLPGNARREDALRGRMARLGQ